MQAGLEEHREIGAVVDDEVGGGFAAEARDVLGGVEEVAAPVRFVADLENARASIEEGGRGGGQREAALCEGFTVENGIDTGQFHRRRIEL